MADPSIPVSDRIFDHARYAAITLAEEKFPQSVPQDQLAVFAEEHAQTFLASIAGESSDSNRAMYVGAFLWAYAGRWRALVKAPTANAHQHFID